MFSVTYEIVTPESAEHGDAEERGYIAEETRLRDALQFLFDTRTSHCDGVEGVETSSSTIDQARWITVYNGAEYQTGARESRSLHFPDGLTPSTRARILRLAMKG